MSNMLFPGITIPGIEYHKSAKPFRVSELAGADFWWRTVTDETTPGACRALRRHMYGGVQLAGRVWRFAPGGRDLYGGASYNGIL